jgi:putative membrane protein
MKNNLVAIIAGALMIVALPAFAASNQNSASSDSASLLNKANQTNQSEEDMANLLSNKAGDNLALSTLATTLKDDHEANESAVKSLASEENVTLQSYHANDALKNKLDKLNGAAFDKAFLEHEAMDHREALRTFEDARNQAVNRDMKLYIDETIPVIRAHLEMLENVRRDLATAGPTTSWANHRESSSR